MKLLLAGVVSVLLLPSAARTDDSFRFPEARHGKGELKYRQGLPVLVVEGSPRESGEQIGALAVKPIVAEYKVLVQKNTDRLGPALPLLFDLTDRLFKRFPEPYRQEVEAMAQAGGVDRQLLVLANLIGDIQHLGGCSAIVVSPERSATSQVLFGRNWDKAPLGGMEKYGLVIVRRPTGKHAFASVTFPGLLVCGTEMNDAGLVLAANDVRQSKDHADKLNATGTALAVGGRQILEQCATVGDAEKLCKDLKATTTGSIILGDPRAGSVFEVTPERIIIRGAADGLCLCTNHFLTKELSVGESCWRFDLLMKYRDRKKLSLEDVVEALRAVHQKEATLQTVVFEPSTQRIHVAVGQTALSKGPLTTLKLRPQFKKDAR